MAVSPERHHTLLGVNPPVLAGDGAWTTPTSVRIGRPAAAGVDSIARCYRIVREWSNSPLLTDQERCLDELEALLSSIGESTESGAEQLATDMEERRLMLMHAMETGTEM